MCSLPSTPVTKQRQCLHAVKDSGVSVRRLIDSAPFDLYLLIFDSRIHKLFRYMEQLKIARQNAELGHYSIALTAYKAAMDSKILTANVSILYQIHLYWCFI